MQVLYDAVVALQIWPAGIDFGSNAFSIINSSFYFKIQVGLHGPSGADRSDARCQIKPGKAERHVMIEAAARGIEQVVMHPDQSRQGRVSGEVHAVSPGWNLHRAGVADRANLSAGDHNGLIGFGGGAGAINQAHMVQRGDRRVYADKFFGWVSSLRLGSRERATVRNEHGNKNSAHGSTFRKTPKHSG